MGKCFSKCLLSHLPLYSCCTPSSHNSSIPALSPASDRAIAAAAAAAAVSASVSVSASASASAAEDPKAFMRIHSFSTTNAVYVQFDSPSSSPRSSAENLSVLTELPLPLDYSSDLLQDADSASRSPLVHCLGEEVMLSGSALGVAGMGLSPSCQQEKGILRIKEEESVSIRDAAAFKLDAVVDNPRHFDPGLENPAGDVFTDAEIGAQSESAAAAKPADTDWSVSLQSAQSPAKHLIQSSDNSVDLEHRKVISGRSLSKYESSFLAQNVALSSRTKPVNKISPNRALILGATFHLTSSPTEIKRPTFESRTRSTESFRSPGRRVKATQIRSKNLKWNADRELFQNLQTKTTR